MFKRSLAFRLLTVCFLILAVPLLIYSFFFFHRFYENVKEETNKTLEESALYRLLSLEELTPASLSFLKELQYLLDLERKISQLPSETFQEKLKSLMNKIEEFDIYVFGPKEGSNYPILASTKNNAEENFENNEYLNFLSEKGKGHFLVYLYDQEKQKAIPYLYTVLTIYDSSHKILGYLAARNEIYSEQNRLLESYQEHQESLSFAIIDEKGVIQAATDSTLQGQLFHKLRVSKDNNAHFMEFEWNNATQLAALAKSQETDISVLAYLPKKQIFLEVVDRFLIIYLTFALIVLIGLAMILFLTQWLSSPLDALLRLMKRVRQGNLNARYRPQRLGFEFNFLGSAFNETISSLLDNMNRVENETMNKEIVRKEIEVAKNVQKALLPKKIPQISGIELFSTYFETREVGGDFYDFFVRDHNLYLIIADAAGLGLSPCLYALNVRSFFRAYAQTISDVGELMCKVNNAFYDDAGSTGMFVTALAGVYHIESRIFTYYSAGHVPGIIRKKNGKVILLERRGMALGLKKADFYTPTSIFLEEGDLVLFYTDGVIEATNEKNQIFSLNRLVDILHQRRWQTAQDFVEGLRSEIKKFVGSVPQTEEFAIVALQVKGNSSKI